MKHVFYVSFIVLSLAACGPLNDMSDMKDSTSHMDATTSHMNDTTTDMDKEIKEMKALTDQKMTEMSNEMKEMKGITQDKMGQMIDEMQSMRSTTEHMSGEMDDLDHKTTHMSAKMDGMYDLTQLMETRMGNLYDLTHQMLGKMNGLYDMTKEVLATSKKLLEITGGMLDLTHNLYTDNRQNGALDTRYWMIQALDDPKITPGLAVKASYAAKYFMAFEFQVWKNTATDTEVKRQALEGNAIQEFFLEMKPFMGSYNDYEPLSVKNDTKNLMMISVAMGQPNPNQLDAAKQYGFDVLTLKDILIQSLAKEKLVNSGALKPVPPQVDQVLQNKQGALYLLNLRHNTVAMIAITKLLGIDPDFLETSYAQDFGKKILSLVSGDSVTFGGGKVKKLIALATGLGVDLSGQNLPEMDMEIGYLQEALDVRRACSTLSGSAMISTDVNFILNHVGFTLDASKMAGVNPAEAANKIQRVEKINSLIADLNKFKTIKKN